MKTLTADAAVQAWLDELPEVRDGGDVTTALDAGARIPTDGMHPVLVARMHLANAALALLGSDDDTMLVDRALAECVAAVDVAMAAAACGVRVEVLPRAAALLSGCAARLPAARRRSVRTKLEKVAQAMGEALAEADESVRRGQAMLAAAETLAGGATSIRQKAARAAVLARCLAMAVEARSLFARAGDVGGAGYADKTIAARRTLPSARGQAAIPE